jgi:F0F1-type ATP synthase membrane subunit a
MRTAIKSLVLVLVATICFSIQSSAQKVSAAVIDQHYASQAASYQTMMLALAVITVGYMIIYARHKRKINRYMGRV